MPGLEQLEPPGRPDQALSRAPPMDAMSAIKLKVAHLWLVPHVLTFMACMCLVVAYIKMVVWGQAPTQTEG
jgi:hypothetical protein